MARIKIFLDIAWYFGLIKQTEHQRWRCKANLNGVNPTNAFRAAAQNARRSKAKSMLPGS